MGRHINMRKYLLVITTLLVFANLDASNQASYYNKSKPMINWITLGTYLGADVGGSYQGYKWGRIGGAHGMALGIVVDGCAASGWLYMERHNPGGLLRPVIPPANPQTISYMNEFERSGYLHNTFLVNFINNSGQGYRTPESYIDALYEPLCTFLSNEFHLSINEIKQQYTKAKLIQLITPMGINTSINDHANMIAEDYGNTRLSDEYKRVLNTLLGLENKNIESGLAYINSEISLVSISNNFSEEEKLIMRHSLNILKYSFSLWTAND